MELNNKKYEKYLTIKNNESYEEPSDLSIDEFIEYLNYHKISSIIGSHNHNKDQYLYALLFEDAYDSNKDTYFNYIKIGYSDDDPIKNFYTFYRNYYPLGTIKILMLIKMLKPKFIKTEIKKLCINLKLENIYTQRNGANESKSTECYLYNDTMKYILNSYLLENKKEFLSYYFNEDTEFFRIINSYIVKKELNKNMNEKELNDYELSLTISNDDYLNNKENIRNIIDNNQIKECPKDINKDIEKKYCAVFFDDPINNIYGWYYGKINYYFNEIIEESPDKINEELLPNIYNMIIKIFTKENNFETKIVALTENYGIENCWVLLKDVTSI